MKLKKVLIFAGTLVFLHFSHVAFAKPSDSDLVVPSTTGQADQDRIQSDKMKNTDVSDQDAQSRKAPPRPTDRTYLVPDFDTDDDARESAAEQVIEKGKVVRKIYKSNSYGAIHGGPYNPMNLSSAASGITYSDVYGPGARALVQVDYEYDFIRSAGYLGVKGGLGFFSASGQGRFVHTPSLASDETLTLYCFPISGGLAYHMQYWDRQYIIPYGEGGLDYFGIFEIRSDATSFGQGKFGGGAAGHVAAGIQIQLDAFDKQGAWELHKEYSINHLYLLLGIRQFVALSSVFDFSATMFEGGFAFQF